MRVQIHEQNGFKSVQATETIQAGEMVLDLSTSATRPTPTRTSIQVGVGRHAEDPVGMYVNHSCNPSCAVIGGYIVALLDLQPGREITFNYSENEGALASPFTCLDCGQKVTGPPPPCRKTT